MTAPLSPAELADRARAEVADLLDLQLSPLGLAAITALDARSGQTILDVGCGAGQTVLQLADHVGPRGRVIGVDIAPCVLAVARSRAAGLAHVDLLQADAATLDLPDATLDGVYSRFGVLALDDPVVAFTNFHRMLRPGGRLGLVCWRSLHENELDLLPLRATELDLEVDGTPFRFERPEFVRDVLQAAGFIAIEIVPYDAQVSSGGLEAMMAVLTKVGPLGKCLRETPALLPRVEPKLRSALRARAAAGMVSLTAATWLVTAERR